MKENKLKNNFKLIFIILVCIVLAGCNTVGKATGSFCDNNGICEGEENNVNCPGDCSCDYPPGADVTNSYYVDVRGICGECNDDNGGSINQPWCTISRAFNRSKSPYMAGSNLLYVRNGINRYKSSDPIEYISGTEQNPTIVSGYPNDKKPSIYFSHKIDSVWLGCEPSDNCNNPNIKKINWKSIVQKKYPELMDKKYCYATPQLIVADRPEPILLQQVNVEGACINNAYLKRGMLSVRTNQRDMVEGDYYYNMSTGFLYVWLPNGYEPNNEKIEVGLPALFRIKNNDWFFLKDLKFRYSSTSSHINWCSVIVNGGNAIIDNVDAQYLDSCINLHGKNGILRNSILSNNGYGGGTSSGKNTILENNTIVKNNWRWHSLDNDCGTKFFGSTIHENLTIRNNLFQENYCYGLWFDYMNGGHLIEENAFVNNYHYGFFVEASGDLDPIVIRNNVFKDCNWGIHARGNGILEISDNLFYNSNGIIMNVDGRVVGKPNASTISNNVFVNNSIPLALANCTYNDAFEKDCSRKFKTNILSDKNLFLDLNNDRDPVFMEVFFYEQDLYNFEEWKSIEYNSYGHNSKLIETSLIDSPNLFELLEDIEYSNNKKEKIDSIWGLFIPVCDNDGTCDEGENYDNCPSDCASLCSNCGAGWFNVCNEQECLGLGNCEFSPLLLGGHCNEIILDLDNDGFNSDVDCNDTNSSIYPGAQEMCNGVDDDCDDDVDEDYSETPTTCGVGYCSSVGLLQCVNGAEVDSCIEGTPLSSNDATNDGIDDDCDGQVDEDYISESCNNDGKCEDEESYENCPKDCECYIDSDCDDSDVCTVERCISNKCSYTFNDLTCYIIKPPIEELKNDIVIEIRRYFNRTTALDRYDISALIYYYFYYNTEEWSNPNSRTTESYASVYRRLVESNI